MRALSDHARERVDALAEWFGTDVEGPQIKAAIAALVAGGNGNGHPAPDTAAAAPSAIDGAAFILDAPTDVPAVWGRGQEVLWASGESLLITGPPGAGKSTIAQQIMRGRLGLTDDVLGYPVAPDPRPVVLLALDRPPQIARSLRRMFTEDDRDVLRERLVIAKSITFDPLAQPKKLAELVRRHEAGTLVIDSLYNLAPRLSDDDVGSAITRALAAVLETGCQVAAIHHHRKASGDNKKPRTLDDVYGSRWITSGAGSVVTVWGQAGDVLVDLLHLKQPAEEIGPLELEHDHTLGRTTVRETPDPWTVLHAQPVHGTTAPDAAHTIYGAKATRSQTEKVRRRLERFVAEGHARRHAGTEPGDPVRYHPTLKEAA